VKALCWTGVNETAVETVEDPKILNDHDVILKVRLPAGSAGTAPTGSSHSATTATRTRG